MTDRRTRKRAAAAARRAAADARAADIAAAAALRAEEIAEEQAPHHQRVAVVDAAGTELRGPLAERDEKRGGYRRADTLRRAHNKNAALVTGLHLRAALRLALSYEVGHGAKLAAQLGGHVDGGAAADVPQRQLDALQEYRRACDALPPSLRSPVQWVAIHGYTFARVAQLLGLSEASVSGYVVAGLDCLCDHYWPDRTTREAAAREDDAVDAGVTDIPQERLGRVARAA